MDVSPFYPCLVQARARANVSGRGCLAVCSFKVETIETFNSLAVVQAHRIPYTFWETDDRDTSLLGWGAAAVIVGEGQARFESLKSQWANLNNSAVTSGPLKAIAMGGMRFDPLGVQSHHWAAYADAEFTLHQVSLIEKSGVQYLLLQCLVEPDDDLSILMARYQELVYWSQSSPGIMECHGILESAIESIDEQRWKAKVRDAVAVIRDGLISKVVLARSVLNRFDGAVDVVRLLSVLRDTSGSHLFAIGRRGVCFLGATPERLVSLVAGNAQTLALAGTIQRADDPETDASLGQALMSCEKELHEHALVVQAIKDALEPLSSSLRIPEHPTLRRLRKVQHLSTPINARVDSDVDVLELVQALHPTPAVAGEGKREAMQFIRENEELDRGWYAAPVGWMNSDGEGDFVVALRSALVDGNECRLFAGCGIVSKSDAENEYRETCLKLSGLQEALRESAQLSSAVSA